MCSSLWGNLVDYRQISKVGCTSVSSKSDTKHDIAEYVRQTTAAQGVPEKVTDPATIAKLQAMCAKLDAPDQG